jgi:hypothetical protein
MGNKINLTRYYELLEKITQSEKKFNETAYGSYIGIVSNLNVSHLNRQCRRPRK